MQQQLPCRGSAAGHGAATLWRTPIVSSCLPSSSNRRAVPAPAHLTASQQGSELRGLRSQPVGQPHRSRRSLAPKASSGAAPSLATVVKGGSGQEIRWGSYLSVKPKLEAAIEEAVEKILGSIGTDSQPELAIVFVSSVHGPSFDDVVPLLRQRVPSLKHIFGCSVGCGSAALASVCREQGFARVRPGARSGTFLRLDSPKRLWLHTPALSIGARVLGASGDALGGILGARYLQARWGACMPSVAGLRALPSQARCTSCTVSTSPNLYDCLQGYGVIGGGTEGPVQVEGEAAFSLSLGQLPGVSVSRRGLQPQGVAASMGCTGQHSTGAGAACGVWVDAVGRGVCRAWC